MTWQSTTDHPASCTSIRYSFALMAPSAWRREAPYASQGSYRRGGSFLHLLAVASVDNQFNYFPVC